MPRVASILFLLAVIPAFSQITSHDIWFVTTDPAGACLNGQAMQYNFINGNFWGCENSIWTQVSGGGGGGTVTSVGLSMPSWFSVANSPVTTSGTLTVTAAGSQTSHQVIGTCGSATSFAPCSLVAGDLPAGTGTVTSVSFTGGLISVANPTTTPALTVAGTSGGVPYFSGAATWASSGALVANGVVLGGGAGNPPTVTTADSTTTHALFATAGAPAFRAIVSGDLPAGTGTVTSIATTSPITGGTITTTGTIACATCVTSAAALTNNQLVFGAGLQATAIGDLTGDVTTSGGKATTLTNIPSGTTMAGSVLATAIAAPGTPASGKGSIYVDSTSKNLAVKDDAGVVKHGVQTDTGAASNYISAISDAGAITKSRPSCATLSDSASGCSTAALGTPVTIANGGTGTGSTLTGLVRGNASAMTAAELSGDATTSGSNAVTVVNVGGTAGSTVKAHSFGCTFPTPANGQTCYITNDLPFACTIGGYALSADAGTFTVKFWRVATGTAIPTVSNSISTSGVSLSTGTAVRSTTTSDFTSTAMVAHDLLAANITAMTGSPTFIQVLVECNQ